MDGVARFLGLKTACSCGLSRSSPEAWLDVAVVVEVAVVGGRSPSPRKFNSCFRGRVVAGQGMLRDRFGVSAELGSALVVYAEQPRDHRPEDSCS